MIAYRPEIKSFQIQPTTEETRWSGRLLAMQLFILKLAYVFTPLAYVFTPPCECLSYLSVRTDMVKSAENILEYFSYFSHQIGFDSSCKLSPMETICMKGQHLFSGKNEKNISECCLLKFYQVCRMLQCIISLTQPHYRYTDLDLVTCCI